MSNRVTSMCKKGRREGGGGVRAKQCLVVTHLVSAQGNGRGHERHCPRRNEVVRVFIYGDPS